MLKKIVIMALMGMLAACVSTSQPQSAIPAEYAGADFQLSDAQAKQWAFSAKQREQCIYPNLTRIQYEHFAKEDAYIYSQYIYFYPLEDIVGEDGVKMIQNDEKSMNYAAYQYKKFKSKTAVAEMDGKQCKVLQTKARDDLAVVKGERKSAMVEEQKPAEQDKSSPEGKKVASDDNRFFFDIIKWGSALFLL